MKDYDAYLFDWDGTLADSHPLWLGIMHGQLRRHGIELSDSEVIKRLFGRYSTGIREFGFSEEEVRRLDDESLALGTEGMRSLDLFPGAHEVLVRLHKQGKKVGLVTASYREIVEIALKHRKILDLFDVTVMGDEVRNQKPDPEMIMTALRAVNVQPDRAIVVGDSPKDLLAANNAGTDSLLFYPPEHELQHSSEELEACRPTYTVRSWQELLDQLQ